MNICFTIIYVSVRQDYTDMYTTGAHHDIFKVRMLCATFAKASRIFPFVDV